MSRTSFGLAVGLGAAVALAALPAVGHANGRMPASVNIHFAPNNDQDIYLQVTFGLLESHDGGATWHWVCEEAIGYSGTYDPDYDVSPTKALFATTFDGLKVRRDGCTFESTQLGADFISAVTVGPDGAVYAAAANASPPDSKIYKSIDDGVTFNPTGATSPGTEASWKTIMVAPSDATRIYASGYLLGSTTPPKQVTLYRSDDGGTSWMALPTTDFTTSTNSDLIIAAVSPDDPDLVFARITYRSGNGVGDAVYRSTNAGASWTKVKEFDDTAPGVVVRKLAGGGTAATSAHVVVGTPFSGTWLSTDGGQTFTQASASLQVACMQEHSGTLWACGNNNAPDNMLLGKSTDATAWTKVVQYQDILGPTQCASGTVEHDTCQLDRWCTLRTQFGIVPDETNSCAAPVADGAASGDGSMMGGDGGGGGKKGCGCQAGGGPGGSALVALAVVVPFLPRRRRRRRRR
jgi:MYXO-CTERM domain-containing protein